MTSLVLVCAVFYLIGSIPTAYILVKLKYKKTLTREGSGNIGARNTYDVTNSRLDGIIVLIIDFLKGLIPAYWFAEYSGFGMEKLFFPAIFLLLGHNYSVWIGFKGGRGLATGAGIMAVLNFSLILIWLIFCALFYYIFRNIHIANALALIFLPVSLIIFHDFLSGFNSGFLKSVNENQEILTNICSAVCFIILIKHISPLMDYYKDKKKLNNN